MLALAALLPLALGATPAAAARCPRPADLAPAPLLPVRPEEVRTGVPLAYYLLAISWAPEWRRTNGRTAATTPELDPPLAAQGFVLHGLWPNGKAPPYPRYCRPVGALPPALVDQMYCRTPSAALLQHEWQAHGACAWPTPQAYFRQAARLFDRVVLPPAEALPADGLTAGVVRRAFLTRNHWLGRDAVFVQADRDGRLTEVRLCYDLSFRSAACPGGVGAPDERRLTLTPIGR